VSGFGSINEDLVSHARQDSWDYGTCQRPDGSFYGHGGVKCHKGVESESPSKDQVKRVGRALNSSFEDFSKEFGASRQAIMDKSAEEAVKRIEGNSLSKLNKFDVQRAIAAKRIVGVAEEIEALKALGNEGKSAIASIKGTKEFFDDMKWRLVNERMMISEGTLRMAWEGTDLNGKARDIFPGGKYGQSLRVVTEHPVPTKVAKSKYLESGIRDRKGTIEFFGKNNFLSLTSAPEDAKINNAGWKSKMPDSKKVFSRYDDSKVKIFPLKTSSGMVAGSNPNAVRSQIFDSAQGAKANGSSFEEWAATQIDI